MMNKRMSAMAGALLWILSVPPLDAKVNSHAPIENDSQKILTSTVRPLHGHLTFERNVGQVDHSFDFITRSSGYMLLLSPSEALMVLQPGHENSGTESDIAVSPSLALGRATVGMKLKGANRSAQAEGLDKLPGIVNYFVGNDPEAWHTNVPTYARAMYKDAYPGIDIIYYGNQGSLEYDFLVSPGANPDQIRIVFEGTSEIRIAQSGDLLLTTAIGEVRVQKPLVYQLDPNGHKTLLAGQYIDHSIILGQSDSRTAGQMIGVQVGAYDTSKPLVIDPVVVYSTYFGASSRDVPTDVAVDKKGNIYMVGWTRSTDFLVLDPNQPALRGSQDAFLTKFDRSGVPVFSTYWGGSADDDALGLVLEGNNHVYVVGGTLSTDFPIRHASQPFSAGLRDGYLTKFSVKSGAIQYSTYLGGSLDDSTMGIGVDSSGQAVVLSTTDSADFPVFNASQPVFGGGSDAVITKFSPSGMRLYSTFLGGSLAETPAQVAVDSDGNAYVTGRTNSQDFPTINAIQPTLAPGVGDAFVTKLSPTGSRLYSTFLGGSSGDGGSAIATDDRGQAYVTGFTVSPDFPLLNPSQQYGGLTDVFVTKLDESGGMLYSTYLGGAGRETVSAIAVDHDYNIYVTGQTPSVNFPVINATQPTPGGSSDAFITKFNGLGARVFSTFLGGSGGELGQSVTVDRRGNAYVVGWTTSLNFPLVNPSQSFNSGDVDAFLIKISKTAVLRKGTDDQEDDFESLDGD